MLGLRQKLSLGFGGLLLIIVIIGVQSITQLSRLGEAIDVILRENYRSVIACQAMKESIERIDSGVMFILSGYPEKGIPQIDANERTFEQELDAELGNITLPGEGEKAQRIRDLYLQYKATILEARNPSIPPDVQRSAYFTKLLPLFEQIKNTADDVMRMNQDNMVAANAEARQRAASARKRMYILLVAGAALAAAFTYFTGRWVLRPITRLIQSTNEITRGNLDLVVASASRDEIGQLSESFNTMAASLREFRRSDRANLARIQRATQQAFDSLPEAIAVVDLDGTVEVSTGAARDLFGLRPGTTIHDTPQVGLSETMAEAVRTGRTVESHGNGSAVQRFVDGYEHFYRLKAAPILDQDRQAAGVILILQDITQLRQMDEIKRGVISTVSHQLKTPLTSIRMAVYLLLDEKVGPLTAKQTELLIAARDDGDRLYRILEDLMDISRIEAGWAHPECRETVPFYLVVEAIEPFRATAKDRGVALTVDVPLDLPDVWADPARVEHVFANLVSNALRYTTAGGKVTLSASANDREVLFSVADTGKGIPKEWLPHVFEQFFRVPDQGGDSGAGLGLAIAKEIVEAHGGAISAQSHEGQGAVFQFTLKRADTLTKDGTTS
ncbi:MAG: HAMP domain-containing protein [Candidatus Hydrogenedentes bacterium]|nr:HAMP domain-containing protein [Candidatus Hydrogenedentota bacterium]